MPSEFPPNPERDKKLDEVTKKVVAESEGTRKSVEKGFKDFEKPLSKWHDTAKEIEEAFSGFSKEQIGQLARSAMAMESSLEQFTKARLHAETKFSGDLTAAFRETQKWADRTSFDIAVQAQDNLRQINDHNKALTEEFGEMQSAEGSFLEQRLLDLQKELLTADQEKAGIIMGEMRAIRQSDHNLNEKEAARIESIATTLETGMGSLTSSGNVLFQSVKEALPSLDKFAENILGGGILGKTAGILIRKRRASKEAKAKVAGEIEQKRQQDVQAEEQRVEAEQAQATAPMNEEEEAEMARYQTALGAGTAIHMGGEKGGEEISTADIEQRTLEAIEEMNSNLIDGLGVKSPGFLSELLAFMQDNAGDDREEEGEEGRIEERRHDELIAALGAEGGKKGEGGADKGFLGMLAGMGKALGKAIRGLLTGIAKGIAAFGTTKVLKGILAIGLLGIALVPFAYGLKQFTDINFMELIKGAGALVIFAVAAGVMGQFASQILMGALAIGVLGIALIPFAFALGMFAEVSWADVFIGLGALVAFAVVAGVLGMFAPFIFIGALAIAALGASLIPAAIAMLMFGAAATLFGVGLTFIAEAIALVVNTVGDFLTTIVDNFIRLGEVGGAGMISAAGGIIALAGALIAFTAAGAAAQLLATASSVAASALSFLFGTPAPGPFEMLQMFIAFGEVAPTMGEGAKGIDELTVSLQKFGAAEFDTEKIAETIGVVAGLGAAIKAFMGGEPGLLEGIGNLVGGALSGVASFFGSFFGMKKPKKTPLEILQSIARTAPFIAILGPALEKFTKGLMKLLGFQGSKFPSTMFDDMSKAFKKLPAKMIDQQANAVMRFADAVGALVTEVKELNIAFAEGSQLALVATQDANTELRFSAEQAKADYSSSLMAQPSVNALSNTNVVTNDSQHFHMPINSRNSERTLNDLMARRR